MSNQSMSAATQERGQRAAVFFNLFGNVSTYIVVGQVMALFASDVLDLSGKQVGTILAAIPLLAVLRLPLLPFVRRLGMTRTLRISVVVWLTAVISILLLPTRLLSYPLYMGLLLLAAGADQVGVGSVWQPLLREITRDADRGRFFARMRFWFSMVTTVTLAVIPLVVGQRMTALQYKLLLLIALGGGLNRLFWVGRLPTLPPEPRAVGRAALSWRHVRDVLQESPLLRYPLLITILWALSTVPIYVVYLKSMLFMPSYLIASYIWAMTLMQALSLLLWGRLADVIGFRPMCSGLLVLGMLTAPLHLLLQPFAPEMVFSWTTLNLAEAVTIAVLLVIGMTQGFIGAGLGIALTTILHHHAKGKHRLEALNLHQLVTMLVTAATAFWSGYLLEAIALPLGSRPLFNGILHFDWIKGYMLVGVVPLKLCTLLALRRLSNARLHFTTADFFGALSPAAMRNLWTQRRLYHADDQQRAETAHRLGVHVSPMGLDPLLELLTDPGYDVKIAAIRALARTNSAVAGDKLLETLQDRSSQQVADHLAWALGELRHAPALPILLDRLQPVYAPRIRAMAARALGKINAPAAVPELAAALAQAGTSQHLRGSCCWALLQFDVPGYADEIVGQFANLTDRDERYELAELLCRKLSVPTEWLLRHTRRASLAEALLMHIELRGEGMEQGPLVRQIVDNGDLAGLRQQLATRQQDLSPNAFAQAIAAQVEKLSDWQPICVIAAAWLLLGSVPVAPLKVGGLLRQTLQSSGFGQESC